MYRRYSESRPILSDYGRVVQQREKNCLNSLSRRIETPRRTLRRHSHRQVTLPCREPSQPAARRQRWRGVTDSFAHVTRVYYWKRGIVRGPLLYKVYPTGFWKIYLVFWRICILWYIYKWFWPGDTFRKLSILFYYRLITCHFRAYIRVGEYSHYYLWVMSGTTNFVT